MAFPAINDFKNALLDGGQRPSLFQMELTFPLNVLASFGASAEQVAPFHIKIAEIPPAIMNPVVVKYAGREVKYATQRQYQPITVTIINDESFTVRRALERWFETMNSRQTNISAAVSNLAGVGSSYAGRARIRQFSKTGDVVREYILADAFPTNIGAIQLSWDNESAIGEYTCEFQYQYWDEVDLIVGRRALPNAVPLPRG